MKISPISRARESTLYTLPLHFAGGLAVGMPVMLFSIMRNGSKAPSKEESNFYMTLWGALAAVFMFFSVRACYKAELKTEISKDNGTYKEDN